ncbi:small heat shock protein, chloroplastic-like [Bidens hawaiensis]|uniref:small heat shock protein, chloroplastic-like n=1 Tax=Bidens hawaiensis TaxID=980011 RepID=UPI00404AA027
MALSLFSQRIITPKSNPSSSLILVPNSHKKKQNLNTIKAENGNLDHFQRASIKTPQQKQPTKKRVVQSSPIVLWDRFPTARTVQQMMDTMERIMDDPTPYRVSQVEPASTYSRGRTPWEIKEGEQDYKMRFDMPGMTKEDVKVWVEEKMLVLKAEKLKKDINNENINGTEINVKVSDDVEWSTESYGKYSFRIALPENIQFEKIKAEVKDGVLYVTIPKAPVASKILDINVQ